MKVKDFDKLTRRDFENGAVLDEIRTDLKIRDELLEACKNTEALLWGIPSLADINKILVCARKTIAKAEGKQE